MKNRMKIMSIILLTFIMLSSHYVLAYDITYLGKYLDPTNSSADKSSIKSLEDYYADIYLYFCARSYSGNAATSGWINSSSDKDTIKDFPTGSNVRYHNSYVNFTGLIKYDGDDTLTSEYSGSSNVTDTWNNGQEKGTFSVVYDKGSGKREEVDIVYPGGEEGKVQLEDFAIVPQNGISASQIMQRFTANKIAIKADESTLDIGNASSIGSMSAPVAAKGDKRIGFSISLAGGNYSLYKARKTKDGSLLYNESIEVLSANAIKKIVQDYAKAYASEVEVDDSSDEEAVKIAIMEAISEDGIRFSRTSSATNPYADTKIIRNMDTAARAIYGMQAGVAWASYNLGYKDGPAGYGDGSGKGNLNTSQPEKGMSVVNHYDNIIIIPFNAAKEKKYEIHIQYKKMEWDKEKEDYKEMEDAPEFAENELVSIKNTVDNKYAKIEQEDIEESGEKFFEKAKVKGAEYKITAEKSFELDEKKWEIVLEECKWSIAETITDAAKNLNKSSNILESNSFKYEFGKEEEKESEIMALRIVYKDEPEEEEEEPPEEFVKTLGPLKLKGTLQFVNMTLTDDYSFAVSDNWADDGKSVDEVLSAGHTSFSSTFNFYKSTVNEKTGNSDYIASGEYLTPYMTDAYYYVVRALKWVVPDNNSKIENKSIKVTRDYYYTVIWGNQNSDSRTIPTNRFTFKWKAYFPLVWRTEETCPFIKDGGSYTNSGGTYYRDTESTVVETDTLYGAYGDHDHTKSCCPGLTIPKESATFSGSYSCGGTWTTTTTTTTTTYSFYCYSTGKEVSSTDGNYVNNMHNLYMYMLGHSHSQVTTESTTTTTTTNHTCTTEWTINQYNSSLSSDAIIYHLDSEVDYGSCYDGSTKYGKTDYKITATRNSSVACSTAGCPNKGVYVYPSDDVYVYGTGTQSEPIDCGTVDYPYAPSDGTKSSCYAGHTHTASCFKKIKNSSWVFINTTIPDSYYTNYVKNYDEDNPDSDPSNHPLTTGINATNRIEEGTKQATKNYNFNYQMKYYQIDNFKMYKISKMEFTDASGYDEVFEDGNTIEIEPSEKYNETFESSENGIQKPERKIEFKLGANTLDVTTEEDQDSEPGYDGIVHWDSTFKKVYTYGLYKGSDNGFTDHFNGYNKTYEQHNVFLGDSGVGTKETKFQSLCQQSVDKMTCTEAILRVGLEVKITDVMNDYFKFVKNYEGSNENLAHNDKSLYFTSDDEEHSSSSQTSTTMLNRNELWRGTVTYTYSMDDGFEVDKLSGTQKEAGEGTKENPPEEDTILGDNGFDQVSLTEDKKNKDNEKGYKDKEGYFKDDYEPDSELAKFIDATNFSGDEEEIYKAYKWDKENSYDSLPDKDKSEKEYVENLKYHVDMSDNKHLTDFYDWSWNALKIWADAHNGTRTFNSTIHYEIVDNEKLNVEVDKKYTNYTENGSLGTAVQDTNQKSEVITLRDESFIDQKASLSECVKINILSPVSISSARIYTTDLINPTDISIESAGMVVTENGGTIYLQKNAQFVIEFANENEKNNANANFGKDSSPDGVFTKKYIREYWVKLSFDCYYNEMWYPAGTYIRSDSIDAFVARTTENYGGQDEGIVEIGENSIEIVAVAINMPFPDTRISTANAYRFAGGDSATETTRSILAAGQVDSIKNSLRMGSSVSQFISTSSTDDAYHAANKVWNAKGIIRIFGFEITDFKDIEYKHIFRKNVSDEYANSGNYFAGRFEWAYSILNENKGQQVIYHNSNEMVDRLSNPSQYGDGYVLPVGPKSQKNGYEYAPKLGYRFSFNVKTTGATTEKVTITPSYYYVSDKGEYISDVDLYYRDSNGIYKKFENYNIYFKPNDGYRYLRFISGNDTSSELYLSSNLETKTISTTFDLEKNGFSTTDYSGYVQIWYGEFKLPNSTIAVPEGSTDLNNPLTNGYIGVKFDISCTTTSGNKAEYSKDIYGTNTSQWDFEGNFGFADAGASVGTITSLNYKGFWNIDQKTWQEVKSTVVLYDTDLRAEDDFQ